GSGRIAAPGCASASRRSTSPPTGSGSRSPRPAPSLVSARRINRVLHIMAIVQLRHDTDGRAYYRRRLAEGKTPMEAIRALKRRLSDIVHRHMLRDIHRLQTGSGGQPGATPQSSAADPNPEVNTSEQALPGPADPRPR